MKEAIEKFNLCEDKKSKKQIRDETNKCRKFWNCYPLHYYRYELYRRDTKLTEDQLIDYIPEFFFYYVFLKYYNPKEFDLLINDKIVADNYFRIVNIPQSHTLLKIINNNFFTPEMEVTDFLSLKRKVGNCQHKKIFVKPSDGIGAHGILVFNRNDSGKYLDAFENQLIESYLKDISKNSNYIIQAGLEQVDELSKIYPHSVNTFRIATEFKNDKARILCATLRLGTGSSQVDNISQGGIMIKIDLESGALADFATNHNNDIFYIHPDTKFVFKGFKIPGWNKVKNYTEEIVKKLPQFGYLGWDIVLTKKGPVALEANIEFGLDHFQRPIGGLRKIFRIDQPYFYWKNQNL